HQLIYDELIRRYGSERAKLYYQANMEGVHYIERIAKDNDIDCQIEEQTSYVYTQDKKKLNKFKREAEAYEKLDIKGNLLYEMPVDLGIVAAVEMRGQAQFHPVTFLHRVLEALKELGVEIFEHSLVTNVKDNDKEDNV